MINIRDVVRVALRSSTSLSIALGGLDVDGEVKVYKLPVKKNVAVPYITIQQIPVRGVESAYGDSEVIETFVVNLAVWHTTSKLAWDIVSVLHVAMLALNPTFPSPYKLALVKRYQSPHELQELASNLTEVVIQYELMATR